MILILILMIVMIPALAGNSIGSITIGDTIIQDIGYIKYSVDNKTWVNAPEYIGDYGHRVAFQCSSALFPNAPWNYKFSDSNWKKIESTWIQVQVLVPDGTVSRIWAYAWKQGNHTYEGGYLLEIDPGYYEFSIKNGENQNWPKAEPFSEVDLARIYTQKREGNKNVQHELAFKGITQNLVGRIPIDFNYKVITGPLPMTKPD